MIQIEPRRLTARERSVLETIFATLPRPTRESLASQLGDLEVTATWAASSASVDTRLAPGARASRAEVASGVLPVRALAKNSPNGEVVGEILVWIDAGVVAGIEYAYYMGDVPAEFPDPNCIELVK